jgi:hypothetical protein
MECMNVAKPRRKLSSFNYHWTETVSDSMEKGNVDDDGETLNELSAVSITVKCRIK